MNRRKAIKAAAASPVIGISAVSAESHLRPKLPPTKSFGMLTNHYAMICEAIVSERFWPNGDLRSQYHTIPEILNLYIQQCQMTFYQYYWSSETCLLYSEREPLIVTAIKDLNFKSEHRLAEFFRQKGIEDPQMNSREYLEGLQEEISERRPHSFMKGYRVVDNHHFACELGYPDIKTLIDFAR